MAIEPKKIIFSILSVLSGNVFAQDKKAPAMPADTSGTLDSLYIEFSSHGPQFEFLPILYKMIWIVIISLAGILLWRYLIKPLLLFIREKYAPGEQIYISGRIVVIIATGFLILTEIINPTETISTIILASVGLCAALAARGILYDFFSGLVLVFNQSLKVGDYILWQGHTGQVKKIGLINTLIETSSGQKQLFPNHTLTTDVINKLESEDPISPVVVDFYLPETADIIAVKEIAQRSATLSRFIYLNRPVSVTFCSIFQEGNPGLRMQIHAYALHVDYADQLKSDITENVSREIAHRK